MKKNITYLIPLDSLGGGVEVAAKGLKDLPDSNFNFNVEYIYKNKAELFDFLILLRSVKRIYLSKPDVLILSLWRAQLAGIFLKVLLPRTKIILFVHSAEDAHYLDYILSRIILFISSEVWGDSVTSLMDRFKFSKKAKTGRVITFSARKILSSNKKNVNPSFIFWGRVGKEKAVERAVLIFSKILKFHPNATFKIIGSDGGTLTKVKELCISLNVSNSVFFYDEMDFLEIEKYAELSCFYLQTSLYEGAAMSVMESMKLGLVPIVTPVGEISRYCNKDNAVVVYSNNEAVRDVLMILESQKLYESLSLQASLKFKSQNSYVESMYESSQEMLMKWF